MCDLIVSGVTLVWYYGHGVPGSVLVYVLGVSIVALVRHLWLLCVRLGLGATGVNLERQVWL